MAGRFTWAPFYEELASRLRQWRNRQGELIAFLEELRGQGLKITPFMDQNQKGERFLIRSLDPFTFFGVFNRGIREDQRLAILKAIKEKFNVSAPLPSDFDGIPILANQRSWFIPFEGERNPDDVDRHWRVFDLALDNDPFGNPEFIRAFDGALEVKNTNINLTLGLFWIRPSVFVSLDQTNRQFLNIKLPTDGLSADFYVNTARRISEKYKSLPELSFQAWMKVQETESKAEASAAPRASEPISETEYWMVGAYWSSKDPPDMAQQFIDEGIWQNGYKDHFLDEVKSMRVGDRIAIKASSTQRHNLPFDAGGKTVSKMTIKAIGTIVANRGDGRTVEVEWDPEFQPKDWFFYTYQQTVWHLRKDDEYARKLIEFVFSGAAQDYAWFCQRWWGSAQAKQELPPKAQELKLAIPYSVDDIPASGVFVPEEDLRQALDRLKSKKNLILQGPPGVGKTFIARKLAWALMEACADDRIQMIQFHQSYSYDDFVRGYRPVMESPGTFALQDGTFFKFCQRAKDDPDNPYVFIIDEINRGNLSQIFGELLMLIESDKREKEFAVPLVYQKPGEPLFHVPSNLFLIGLMNLADRSLAMVDYALRRRFAFMPLRPRYDSTQFKEWLAARNMASDLIDLIIARLTALNDEIVKDPLLGENYQVGHSFFCPKGDNFAGLDRNWYNGIIETEIAPLLREYWFDNPERAEQARQKLLA